ncbi:MAG: histidine--tRNA ligase [Desulfobulbaceae bacterium]|nr:MAG: histidine--tRNA ligase [Desulfobulbaceae bacterium]
MKIKALNGFKDVLPDEVGLWREVENQAREVFRTFHFSEIRLPILEKTDLFARSIGADTDIVEKEMYTFVDKQVTMRPEATASLMRAYIQHSLHTQKPVQRLFTIGPMFRHERPQKGRLRQFHQIDVEILGSANPRVDAELMAMAAQLFDRLGISVSLEMNSLGCPACRPAYRKLLLEFIESRIDKLCDDCKRRSTRNPLRVLDCKKPACRQEVESAPSIIEHLCQECSEHFSVVQQSLDSLGVSYQLNKFMVRGLDYYVRTTFEFITDQLGAQSAVCAGGRYDGLIELLGGGKIPGIGFAMGIERLVLLLQQKNELKGAGNGIDLFLAGLGDGASDFCYQAMHELRTLGFSADMDLESRSLKSQMKQADKAAASYTLIVGDQELEAGKATIRNMATKEQKEITLSSQAIATELEGGQY